MSFRDGCKTNMTCSPLFRCFHLRNVGNLGNKGTCNNIGNLGNGGNNSKYKNTDNLGNCCQQRVNVNVIYQGNHLYQP